MTDNDKQPEPTPAEQHEKDLARVERQLDVTDVARKVTSIFGGNGFFARTDFEGHELNIMIDMVLNANPADLESAGDNLWNARKDLRDAAEELRTNIKEVHWEGASGEAFRDFGRALADHADQLGTFADIAATQIRVAGTGLASVRSSMPERDLRLIKHNAKTMPLPERIDTNPDYVAAKKVEKNRQEAINQMNRLASFYAVSEQTLAGQEPPTFSKVLNADVPRPSGEVIDDPSVIGRRPRGLSESPRNGTASERREGSRGTGENRRPETVGAPPLGTPERNPSMELDSAAPPPTTPNSVTPVAPSPGPIGGPPTVPGPSTVPPVPGASPGKFGPGPSALSPTVSKATGGPGLGGGKAVAAGAGGHPGAQGRPGIVGGGPSATGGSNPTGRPTGPMGGGSAASSTGRANPPGMGSAMGGQGPMTGRGGTAAQPMGGRTPSSSAGSRAGRDGIVGGTPQRAPGGASGPRIPRGNVVGAEGQTAARSGTARPGQAGVVGAGPVTGASRATGGGTPSSHGVVGRPKAENGSFSRPGQGSFTTGGAGLVGGRPGRNPSGSEGDRTESARPDYLTEDEETWTAQRRNAGPPVIE
ncbi:WXG100 family type VII secretion target [Streptomyces qinzhouensis]|uniref:WXG100 family type VII secretion target n=1 Tax=Streptomyces qinzhouensis TaxID=2599401 RepID=A0A5B8JD76_9ACTN|nr:WXG100 family type VII secretion target [Streptomyces qinzhouensis]QDY79326.1 hypothetical protein FQU76_25510 [Streptomyces qinzhouensis]